ncbi:MAG: 5-formyltetrahydrofolate cyclo-ligase [Micrococcales bacterium]|nr:5-formyltetrahydrofolate cyclo-ligase [Micrococcales bacterium]
MTTPAGRPRSRGEGTPTTLSKREVRQLYRQRRRELAGALEASGDREAAGRRIAEQVLALLPESPAGGALRVAAYESTPDEPPTGPLITALVDAGHEVIVPITLEDLSLEWRVATPGTVGDESTTTRAPLPADARTLGADALGSCDLIITPGLTVDPHGVRLGQGGGCYDRALVHRDPTTPAITLLHEGEQSIDPLPRAAHDQLVDGYLTTSGRLVRVDRVDRVEGADSADSAASADTATRSPRAKG